MNPATKAKLAFLAREHNTTVALLKEKILTQAVEREYQKVVSPRSWSKIVEEGAVHNKVDANQPIPFRLRS